MIEETQPTLFIDETDTYFAGECRLARNIECGYHRKMAYVVRVANGKVSEAGGVECGKAGSRLVRFSCWCPKVMRRLADA